MIRDLIVCIMVTMVVASSALAETVNSKLNTTIYGFIQGDVIYSTDDPADIGRSINNRRTTPTQGDLNFSAQYTRLGLNINAPTRGDWNVLGNVEIDFANAPTTSNPNLRLRHGYVQAKNGSFGLLVGQTWMLLAQQNPNTINYNGYLGRAGNLWSRYPQVRFSGYLDKFTLEGAVLKMTNDNNTATAHSLTEEPRYQARLACKGDLFGIKNALIAVGGDIGKYGLSTGPTEIAAKSHAVAAEMNLPINRLTLNGEIFWAKNESLLLGSCGVNPTSKDSDITSLGGYININYKISDKLWMNVGYGSEENKAEKIAVNSAQQNTVIFGNIGYKLTSDLSLIGEYTWNETNFKGFDKLSNNRYQFAVKYDF